MTVNDAFDWFVNELEDDRDVEQRVKDILNHQEHKEEYIPLKKDPIPDGTIPITIHNLRTNFHLRKFFEKRKLYLWHVNRYDLRLYKNDILWTIKFRNKIVSYQKRNILLKKYYNPTNLASYIYGYDNIKSNKPLILVEGFFDYSRIDTFIRCYYKNQINVTTGMAKSISQEQIKRIISCKPSKIVVMYDNDSWFDYWRIKSEMPFDVDFIILPKGADPNELSWNQIKTIFEKEIIL
jgi:hypothetical protein